MKVEQIEFGMWRVSADLRGDVTYARDNLVAREILKGRGVIVPHEVALDMTGRCHTLLYFRTEDEAHGFICRLGLYLQDEQVRLDLLDQLHERWAHTFPKRTDPPS